MMNQKSTTGKNILYKVLLSANVRAVYIFVDLASMYILDIQLFRV